MSTSPRDADLVAREAFGRWAGATDARHARYARTAYVRAAAQAAAAHTAYVRAARDVGTCTVCEREGFQPFELDDSARCDACRP